jgi:hypothetical protein
MDNLCSNIICYEQSEDAVRFDDGESKAHVMHKHALQSSGKY